MSIETALENAEFGTMPTAPFDITFHNPPPELADYSHEDPKTMFTIVYYRLLTSKNPNGPNMLIKLLGIPGMLKVHSMDFRFHDTPPVECLPLEKLTLHHSWRAPIFLMRNQCTQDIVCNRPFVHALKPLIPMF